jgi:hypothetical protein
VRRRPRHSSDPDRPEAWTLGADYSYPYISRYRTFQLHSDTLLPCAIIGLSSSMNCNNQTVHGDNGVVTLILCICEIDGVVINVRSFWHTECNVTEPPDCVLTVEGSPRIIMPLNIWLQFERMEARRVGA